MNEAVILLDTNVLSELMRPMNRPGGLGLVRRIGLDQAVFQRGERGRTAHGRGRSFPPASAATV
jgi:hypothetical protein